MMRALLLLALLLLVAPRPAAAQLDSLKNVAACVVTGFAAGATSVTVNTGCGATLPTVSFNASVCNVTDYPVSCRTTAGVIDPNFEVVRVTAISTDTLTITRAQEGTSDVAHDTGGKTYWISTFTAKTITDVNTALGASNVTLGTNSVLTNERVLTGTSNQITVTDGGAGSTVTLSTPQSIHTAATPTFGGLTIGSSGITGTTNLFLAPEPSRGWALLQAENNPIEPGGGTDEHETDLYLFGKHDSVSNYFTGAVTLGAGDGSFNTGSAHSLLSEGNWTSGGGFTLSRLALYDHSTDTEVLMHQSSSPGVVLFGRTTNGARSLGIRATGKEINTAADGTVSSGQFDGHYNKNDTNTRSFQHVLLKPTFNFGGSNTNTTVNVLDVDTVNTSTTGLTANLAKFSYGGTQRFLQRSTGHAQWDSTNAMVNQTVATGATATSNYQYNSTITDSGVTGGYQNFNVSVGVDWAADPGSKTVNAIASDIRTAADAIAQASATIQGASFNVQHVGTNTIGLVRGFVGTAANGSSGTVTTGRGFSALFNNNSTGTVTTAIGGAGGVTNNNASGTITEARMLEVSDLTNAGTIGTTYGLYVGDITAGTQTNQAWSVYATDTAARSFFDHSVNIGGSANRSTTEGTDQVKLFDGTAPVGTLTNGVSLYSASGELTAMDAAGNAHPLTAREESKTFTIESPTSSENFGGIRFNRSATITKVVAVLQGSSTPSVTWQVRHGSDRSAAGTDLFTANKTTTSITTGAVETATFNDATIAADHFVWFVTTAQSGTVNAIHVTIFYTVD